MQTGYYGNIICRVLVLHSKKLGNRFVVLSGYEQTKLRSGSIFVSLGEPFPRETQKKRPNREEEIERC